jgi:hypothetical protein
MKSILVCLFSLAHLAGGMYYSHRIKALGTDLAWLIPDFQTDLYQDPQILSGRTIGLGFDEQASTPLNAIFTSSRFGMITRLWFEYKGEQEAGYPGLQNTRDYFLQLNDLWMLKIKDEVWNIYNDVSLNRFEINSTQASDDHLLQTLEYFIKTQTSMNTGSLKIDFKIAVGFYEHVDQYAHTNIYNQRIGIPSGRIGLFYSRVPAHNLFIRWYISLGGPISRTEIDSLPYSIYDDLADHERRIKYFGNTLIAKAAWARAWPLARQSFFVLGIRNDFIFQPVNNYATGNDLQAIVYRLKIPLAIEYLINPVYVRIGAGLVYGLETSKESNNTGLVKEQTAHQLKYVYSFGLGWRLNEYLTIDLYNQEYLERLSSWSININCVLQ